MASNPTRRLLTTTDLLTCLTAIPDRRRAEGKMYGQAGVILFSILAMVSGARSYRQIHTVIDRRLGLLNAAFPGAALRRPALPPPWGGVPPRRHAARTGKVVPEPRPRGALKRGGFPPPLRRAAQHTAP